MGASPVAVLGALAVGTVFAAEAEPRVEAVVPGRDGDLLVCSVRTANLPGPRVSASLETGLPSAIEMALDVLDRRDRVVAGNRVSLRIAYDLWEEIFRVESPGREARLDDLAALERFLSELPRLPVAPIPGLAPSESLRIRVGLRLHPIAPRETRRLGEWAAGDPPRDRTTEDPDGREVSVSLGEVIRFFYRGARPSSPAPLEGLSPPFRLEELGRATP